MTSLNVEQDLVCTVKYSSREKSPKIIIIGAGASGIAAASKLLEHHFENVTLLEAEHRIGGRVYTTNFDGYSVDLGGEWVHGERDNVSFDLAWPLDLLEHSVPWVNKRMTIYKSDGSCVPDDIGRNIINTFLDIGGYEDDITNWDLSVGEYLETELTNHMYKIPSLDDSTKKSFLKLLELYQNLFDGTDSWYEGSAKSTKFWSCEGDQLINWKGRGYNTILDILIKKYPNPEKELPVLKNTILNAEVIQIDYSLDKDGVVVTTTDGNVYKADHVIVTTSLGVLKAQYDSLFNPPLPEPKINAIKSLGYGAVAKIYLSFEEQWWSADFSGFAFIWNDEDRKVFENDPDKKWLLSIFQLNPVENKPRLLCCWLSGPAAREMEKLPETVIFNQTFEYIRRFLGKSYNIPKPKAMLRTLWYSNKHFRGTYTYRTINAEKAGISANQLAEPVTKNDKPTVLFAGEATSDHHYTTVHGAIESGWREADRLIKLYSENQ